MAKPIRLNQLNEEALDCLREAQNYVGRKDNPIYYPRMKELYQEFQKATAWRFLESEDSWNHFCLAAVEYRRRKAFNPFKSYPEDDVVRKDGSFMSWQDDIQTKGTVNLKKATPDSKKEELKNFIAEYRDGKWYARRSG